MSGVGDVENFWIHDEITENTNSTKTNSKKLIDYLSVLAKADNTTKILAVRCNDGCTLHSQTIIGNDASKLQNLLNGHGASEEHPLVPVAVSPPQHTPIIETSPLLIKCMKAKFVNESCVIEKFVKQIQNVAQTTSFFNTYSQHEVLQQKPSTYYSPYMVIAQRSGAGKTRLIFEVGRKALLVFYACLSGPFQSTHKITTYINDLRSAEPIEVAAFFVSIADFFLRKLQEEVGKLLGREVAEDALIKKLSPENRGIIIMQMSRFFIPSIASDVDEVINDSFGKIINGISKWRSNEDLQKTVTLSKQKDSYGPLTKTDMLIEPFERLKNLGFGPIVVAIDEARGLLNGLESSSNSSFHKLRKGAIPFFGGMVMILADTCSKVSNFTPEKQNDTNSRREDDTILFPAFTTLCTTDVLAMSYLDSASHVFHENGSWMDFLMNRDTNVLQTGFCNLGLPLWNFVQNNGQQLYFGCSENDKGPSEQDFVLEHLINFAAQKLCGGRLSITQINDDNTLKAVILACLSSKAHFLIRPQSTLPETLVSSHMAHLDFVELDRSKLFISYPSDPVLSAGAGLILLSQTSKTFQILKELSQETAIDIGDQGEFIVQLLLCSAMDVLNNGHNSFKSVTLKSFFETLIGGNYCEMFFRKSERPQSFWEETRISFNHFTNIDCPLSLEVLAFMFARCAGIFAKKCQMGYDLIIPTVLSCGRLSALIIQVKNKVTSIMENRNINQVYEKLIESLQKMEFLKMDSVLLLTINLYAGITNNSKSISSYRSKNHSSGPLMMVIEGFSKELFPNIWKSDNSISIYRDISIFLSSLSFTVDDRIKKEIRNKAIRELYDSEREIVQNPKFHDRKSAQVVRYRSISSPKSSS